MLKSFLIFSLIILNNSLFGQIKVNNTNSTKIIKISENEANRIADAIFKVEGGNNTKYPYGIKSIKTNNPRQTCLNTIKNNYIRWQLNGKKEDYLDFLANRYCPPEDDKQGNINWKKNIKRILKKS